MQNTKALPQRLRTQFRAVVPDQLIGYLSRALEFDPGKQPSCYGIVAALLRTLVNCADRMRSVPESNHEWEQSPFRVCDNDAAFDI
jgi:hypothetical protein